MLYMQKMNKLLISIMTLFASCLTSCGQQDIKSVDADEFEKVISRDGVQLLDVRTETEFREGHIASDKVKNIDYRQPDFIDRADSELDKGRPVAVYCRSGRRSLDAARLLVKRGFEVIDLKGGILEWQERGKPVRR